MPEDVSNNNTILTLNEINLDNNIDNIIDNIVDNSKVKLSQLIECPICLENINDYHPLLILDCCSKQVHLPCILGWYSKRPTNKLCFMCNQSNNFCKDLVYDSIGSEPTNESSYTNNSTSILVEIPDIIIRNNNYKRNIGLFIISLCIGGLLCWGVIVLFSDI
jgi:hypothetical protein